MNPVHEEGKGKNGGEEGSEGNGGVEDFMGIFCRNIER